MLQEWIAGLGRPDTVYKSKRFVNKIRQQVDTIERLASIIYKIQFDNVVKLTALESSDQLFWSLYFDLSFTK